MNKSTLALGRLEMDPVLARKSAEIEHGYK